MQKLISLPTRNRTRISSWARIFVVMFCIIQISRAGTIGDSAPEQQVENILNLAAGDTKRSRLDKINFYYSKIIDTPELVESCNINQLIKTYKECMDLIQKQAIDIRVKSPNEAREYFQRSRTYGLDFCQKIGDKYHNEILHLNNENKYRITEIIKLILDTSEYLNDKTLLKQDLDHLPLIQGIQSSRTFTIWRKRLLLQSTGYLPQDWNNHTIINHLKRHKDELKFWNTYKNELSIYLDDHPLDNFAKTYLLEVNSILTSLGNKPDPLFELKFILTSDTTRSREDNINLSLSIINETKAPYSLNSVIVKIPTSLGRNKEVEFIEFRPINSNDGLYKNINNKEARFIATIPAIDNSMGFWDKYLFTSNNHQLDLIAKYFPQNSGYSTQSSTYVIITRDSWITMLIYGSIGATLLAIYHFITYYIFKNKDVPLHHYIWTPVLGSIIFLVVLIFNSNNSDILAKAGISYKLDGKIAAIIIGFLSSKISVPLLAFVFKEKPTSLPFLKSGQSYKSRVVGSESITAPAKLKPGVVKLLLQKLKRS